MSYANVVATLAMFFALGGGAYAAATIASPDVVDNSLLSRDLKDGAAVTSADVRDDTLEGGGLVGRDIKEATLTQVPSARRAQSAQIASTVPTNAINGSKVADNSLTGADINESTLQSLPGYEVVVEVVTTSAATAVALAQCPDDKVAVGGGGGTRTAASTRPPVVLTESSPAVRRTDPTAGGWVTEAIEVDGGTTSDYSLRAVAICAAP